MLGTADKVCFVNINQDEKAQHFLSSCSSSTCFYISLPCFPYLFSSLKYSEPFFFLCILVPLKSAQSLLMSGIPDFYYHWGEMQNWKHMLLWSSAKLGFKRVYSWENVVVFWVRRHTRRNELRTSLLQACPDLANAPNFYNPHPDLISLRDPCWPFPYRNISWVL